MVQILKTKTRGVTEFKPVGYKKQLARDGNKGLRIMKGRKKRTESLLGRLAS